MARPRKNNAEYFSHDADLRNHIKIRALRSKYPQNIGYSTYNMLLEIMTDADNFRIENNDLQKTLIAGDIGIEEALYIDILDFMVTIGLMQRDREWVWNDHLLERMQPVLNKRKIMQERYQVRGVEPEPPKNTPLDPPKPPKKKKEYLTEDEWRVFIDAYKTGGKNNDSSIYKAKKIFLAMERTYKHSQSGEIRDTWTDIMESLPFWRNSSKWMRGFKHMATTWLKDRHFETRPEAYTPDKHQNNGQAPKQEHRTSKYSDGKV